MRRSFLTTLFVALFSLNLVAGVGSEAKAHHAGPLVRNLDNVHHHALIRNHTWGTRAWTQLSPGEYSPRGAEGFAVPFNARVKFRYYSSSTVYTTGCGNSSTMYTWTGQPYYVVSASKGSVFLLDVIPC